MPLTDFDGTRCPDFNPDFAFKACTYYDPADHEQECGFCKQDHKYYRCIADTSKGIPLSYSTVSDFLTCHYLYYLKSIRGIEILPAKKSVPLKLGTLWDRVQQKHLGADINIQAVITENEIESRDVAKIKGLYRAFKALDVFIDPNPILQARIDDSLGWERDDPAAPSNVLYIKGYLDRKYTSRFVESKLSSRPDNYLDPYFIQNQVGVYFMADPGLEDCVMEICRTPDLKSTGRFSEESDADYAERVYQDAIKRPSHYFLGWDPKTRRYGKKYFRKEFNLDAISDRFRAVFREIDLANRTMGWYRNDRVCNSVLPGIACDMLPICRTGHMSEDMYRIRKREIKF